MTPERWNRVEEMFEAALALAADERDAFLDRSCDGDRELRDEVAALLRDAGDARAELQHAVAAEIGLIGGELAATKVGQRAGPYRIVELVAEGGMGEVFLAERADAEFERKVAIKFLQRGYASADAIARLRDERQILAALDHPNIVRLIDGGTTDDGLPFLVMDYIEGTPLTRYARANELSVRARVELFVEVCAAVQYAHQKLVVHRDLKPSNILVGADGHPRLLDFGIAKLIDPIANRSREAKTGTGVALLTPEYASPERARGEPVTVATDVYSLGAVLYELLADKPALPATAGGLELLRLICEVDPPRPSTQCPPERRSAIAGDLDNIIAKALHKQPEKRYASVAQLADDLERHLSGRPVVARTATLAYRAGKLVRRHWGKIALAAIATAALAGATAVSLVQARRASAEAARAERRFDEVRAIAHSLLFELDPKLRDISGTTGARALVVQRALEYLDRLASESSGDDALALEVAQAYMRVGDIQGNLYEPNLGKPEDALASYAKARAILARLPDTVARRQATAAASFGAAFLEQVLGRYQIEADDLRDAFAAVDTIPPDELDRPLVARGYSCLVQRDIDLADLATGERDAAAMLAYVDGWRARDTSPIARYWFAIAENTVGRVRMWIADPDGAIAADHVALAELDKLSTEFPDDVRYTRERALMHWLLATATGGVGDNWDWSAATGDRDAAERDARAAVDIAHQITARDPNDARALDDEATMTETLAAIVAERSPADGLPLFERSLALWRALPESERTSHYAVILEFFAHCAIAEPLARIGRGGDAIARNDEGYALLERQASESTIEERANCLYHRARAQHAAGANDDALATIGTVIELLAPDIAAHSLKVSRYIGLARTLELRAELAPEVACAARTQAVAAWRAWPGRETSFLTRVRDAAEAAARGCKP
ncbi:MAG TPA: serine/threonine-protein kinase [Kofleriaceae bacterium]|nr:serine/threonine-protein kinase [Kofleriaceae bacterium]